MATGKKKAPAKQSARKAAAGKKAASSSKSSAAIYTDPELRDKLKAAIKDGEKGGKAGEWSARKSQLLAAEYRKAGGGYKTTRGKKAEPQQHLDEWTDQHWKTADGKPAVREGETARYLPEKAWDELTPAQKEQTDRKKKEGSKAGEQVVPNTRAARAARKKS